MEIASLAYRTDVALRHLAGGEIEARGDHLVVRTPANPTFWWGNFLLLPAPPSEAEAGEWLARFAEEFPGAGHLAFGVDGTAGSRADLAPFAERGLRVEESIVMTATSVHEPPRPNRDASYRPFVSDEDWAQSIDLTTATRDDVDGQDEAAFRLYATRRAAANRALVEAGRAVWFGAFLDGRLASQMGLIRADEELGRYQHVETHEEFRGRGLAGTLVHRVARHGFDEMGVRTLVMVADPDYLAVRIYRSVGFSDNETQLQADRAPGAGSIPSRSDP